MLKKHLKFNTLFALIFLLQLLAEFNQLERLRSTTKPMIVLALMLMLAVGTKLKGRFHKRIFAGLIFALSGDILLLSAAQNPAFLMYGLFAFLICHICYISAFYLDFRSAPELDKKGARIAILLGAAFGIGFYFYIRPHLGAMRLPVLAYTFVISLMTMMAVFRNQRVNRSSFLLILVGALCLLVSDSLMALNKFVHPYEHAGLFIMATYMIAQYLITMGAVDRKLINKA
jgi:uncharacterized membrane protein YhhN